MIINREKFEIIRKIIHDTLLGNIALVVIALMSPVLLDKIAEPFNIIIASAMSISFIFILCWLASSIWLYTGEFAKNKSLRCTRGPPGKRKFSHAKRIELNEWLHPSLLTH
ncbi:TPA: hypothetical protein ODN89_004411 [Escherichia coli]|nr:hypothetical protein [Escherichia coli]HCP4322421.1 hypothetical protein [Escherichia coli]